MTDGSPVVRRRLGLVGDEKVAGGYPATSTLMTMTTINIGQLSLRAVSLRGS